ncbi:MAG: asparaginase domain-containing protein [Planctomycetota bacterium]|nr:asparaginase domain-containing protein [Planctomycetota bacterium]
MKVRILVTGGTFDKEYDELHGQLFFKTTHVPEMLRLGRCMVEVEVVPVMLMDSLSMTDAHREIILAECRRSDTDRIVITHGTDTMTVTAGLLAKKLRKKTVVLTGAIRPYTFGSSDGLFNLGSAIAFAQVLPPGVYVAMNGRCFDHDKVRKNMATGVFEDVG